MYFTCVDFQYSTNNYFLRVRAPRPALFVALGRDGGGCSAAVLTLLLVVADRDGSGAPPAMNRHGSVLLLLVATVVALR